MATWKKLVVSGSNVGDLANNVGYLTSATLAVVNSFSTASVNGSLIIADSPSGSLIYASSSGQGLTIAGTSAPDTITFGLSAIPNTSLANSTFNVGAGSGLTGGGSTSLGGTSTVNVGAGTHITVNTDDVAVNTATLIPAISGSIGAGISGSIFSQVSGDITITTGGVATIQANSVALGTDTTGDYVSTITAGAGVNTTGATSGETIAHTISINSASLAPYFATASWAGVSGDVVISNAGVATIQANSVALGTDTTGNYVASLGAGTGTTVGGTTGEGAVPTVNVSYGSTAGTAVQGNTTISLTGTANEVEITGTTAQALGGGPSYTIGLPNDVTIGNNLIVTNDLIVNGTTTYVNTANLYVEDQFILVASGSANNTTDGGIIVDRGAYAAGNIAIGYDSATFRWGLQNGLTDPINAVDLGAASAGVSGSFLAHVFTEATHGATKPITGEFAVAGAIYTSTAGDIFMYS